MAIPTNRVTLAEYCFRKLGAPVLEINVDEDQVDDRIDEALQYFQAYHDDAIERTYIPYVISSTDVANKYIDLTDAQFNGVDITSVRRILPIGGSSSGTVNMFDARYQIMLNDIFDLGHMGNLYNYAMIQQYIGTLNMILNGAPQTRFNRHMNKLYIDHDWQADIEVGDYIVIDAMVIVDPNANEDVYNDQWLKRYATALIKRQWGENMIKFEGMQLPGGVTMNGAVILEAAMNEIEKLEDEIRLSWELPVDMMVG